MKNKNACRGCIGSNYHDYNKVLYPRVGKFPMLEKYGNLIGRELSVYIYTLSLNGYSDDSIAVALGVRWSYLFRGLTFVDWFQLIEEFRENENQGSCAPAPAL